ncbi:MHYT domain-containing protein [Lichenicola sp.]|uniref:MHYT domain-containing protein n=1 Tax=Lichenicola sp. TaxID=2804529 RepID=UPI003B005974
MLKIADCLFNQHDLRLVGLAVGMCILACMAASALLSRAQASTGRLQIIWASIAAIEFGGGIWSLHFVAMIAFMPGIGIAYDIRDTMMSIFIPIAGALAGFGFLLWSRNRIVTVIGGTLFLTAAIGGMHYTGTAAMRMHGRISVDSAQVALSIVLSAAFSAAAIWVMHDLRSQRRQTITTFLLAGAISVLHFTGMSAITLHGVQDHADLPGLVGSTSLAIAVAGLSIAMLLLSFALSLVDRHLADRTIKEKERLHQLAGVSFEGLVIEHEGIILDANSRFCEMSGYDLPQKLGQPVSMFVAGYPGGQDAVASLDVRPRELVLRCRDGGEVAVELLARPITYDRGPAVAIAVRDITSQKKSQAAMQRLAAIADLLAAGKGPGLLGTLRSAVGAEPPVPPERVAPGWPENGALPPHDIGQIQAISLAALRIAYADDWEHISCRAMLIAERIIKRVVSPEDVFSRAGDEGFALWFASDDIKVNRARLAKATREIRLAFLHEFGEAAAHHTGAALVSCGRHDAPGQTAVEVLGSSLHIAAKLQDRRARDAQDVRALFDGLSRVEVTAARPVIDRNDKPTDLELVDFDAGLLARISDLAVALENTLEHGHDLDLLRLDLAIQALHDRPDDRRVLVEVSWSMLSQPVRRFQFDERLATIEPGLRRRLTLAVAGIPPLPHDKRWTQTVEPLRRILGGVGILAMLTPDESPSHAKAMVQDWKIGLLMIDGSSPGSAEPAAYFEIIALARQRGIPVLVRTVSIQDAPDWRELGATGFVTVR